MYYRWAMRPSDGEVLLAHNHEDHPALTRTHLNLAQEINEPNTFHGYAYRIDGGWRLHDYDHKPISDPFVRAQVAKAIHDKENPSEMGEDDSWDDGDQIDWHRTHYGHPMRQN